MADTGVTRHLECTKPDTSPVLSRPTYQPPFRQSYKVSMPEDDPNILPPLCEQTTPADASPVPTKIKPDIYIDPLFVRPQLTLSLSLDEARLRSDTLVSIHAINIALVIIGKLCSAARATGARLSPSEEGDVTLSWSFQGLYCDISPDEICILDLSYMLLGNKKRSRSTKTYTNLQLAVNEINDHFTKIV
jgi:hypothetical protein